MRNMTRSGALIFLLLFLTSGCFHADAHPADFPASNDEVEDDRDGRGWPLEIEQGDELEATRDKAVEKLREVLGIRSHSEKTLRRKIPPQFMMELYKNVADSSGVTRGRNPYNAKVVRSFIERDTSMSHFYFFNISGLEANESVLEAELHLYRKRTPLKNLHPSTLSSPYYLIRVYQVLEERSLEASDLHKLLNVRYVGAHASGWQIFNVKQAVLSWLNGEPNLGLLVTATTLFEDQVSVEFSRRHEFHHSKQPILVLFDDDGKERSGGKRVVPQYYAYGNDNEVENEPPYGAEEDKIDLEDDFEAERVRRQQGDREQPEEADWLGDGASEIFKREKRLREKTGEAIHENNDTLDEHVPSRRRRDSSRKRYKERAPLEGHRLGHVPTSMEIYERAMLREKLSESGSFEAKEPRYKRSTKSHASSQSNTTECSRHELYVDFKEIGLSSSIIAPLGYSAYHCKGICESPLSQDQQPTNHATIQGIVHKMALVKGVERPCCVPTKLLGTTILFFDDNENVVLKVYQDMIADRCGCR